MITWGFKKMKPNNALKVENLSFKRIEDGPYFFKDENFKINFGQICFVKGNNGTGKSTLFKILTGKHEPNSVVDGTIEIKGAQDNFEQVASLPQKYAEILASKFTFNQNLSLSKLPKFPGLKLFKPDHSAHDITKHLNVDRNIPIDRLSEGQKQILAIKITLLKNPSVLLLDEPTATLDEQNANQVFLFLKDLAAKGNVAIIIICHQIEFICKYGDICLEIKQSLIQNSKSISYIDSYILNN
jgi:ABC-type multidrug transport system ATPase subunit